MLATGCSGHLLFLWLGVRNYPDADLRHARRNVKGIVGFWLMAVSAAVMLMASGISALIQWLTE